MSTVHGSISKTRFLLASTPLAVSLLGLSFVQAAERVGSVQDIHDGTLPLAVEVSISVSDRPARCPRVPFT